MGPFATPDESGVTGDFMIEVSGGTRADVGGNQVGSGMYERVTITSYGVVKPSGGGFCSTQHNSMASLVAVRAHALIGPTGNK